jgi:mannosyltransferase
MGNGSRAANRAAMIGGLRAQATARPLVRRAALAASLAIAACAMLYRLPEREIWFDEAVTITYARLPWQSLWHAAGAMDAFFAPYYAAVHLWIGAFGSSEIAVRTPSVLGNLLAVVALYVLGRSLAGVRVGLTAALVASLSPFFVALGRDARPYPFLVAFGALCSFAFVQALRRRRRAWWLAYGALTLVGAWLDLFLLLVPLSHGVYALAFDRRIQWRAFVAASAAAGVLCIPIVVAVARNPGMRSWIPPLTPAVVLGTLSHFAGNRPALALVALAVGWALVLAVRRRPAATPRDTLRAPFAFLLTWLFVPVLVLCAASLAMPIYQDRYLAEAYPAAVLLIALALAAVPWPAAAVVGCALIVADVRGLAAAYDEIPDGMRETVRYLAAARQPGDAVVIEPVGAYTAFAYYNERFGEPVLPSDIEEPQSETYKVWDRDTAEPAELRAILRRYRRVWVVLETLAPHDPESEPHLRAVESLFTERADVRARHSVPHATTLLFVRRSP